MKLIFLSIALLCGLLVTAQPFTVQPGASFFVERGAKIYVSNEANFQGMLTNNGSLILNKDIDFGANSALGSLRFSGNQDQTITADRMVVEDLIFEKQGIVHLKADELIVRGVLEMNGGYLLTNQTPLLVSSGQVYGGSSASYVEGKMSQVSNGSPLYYPVGLNGYFNSLTLLEAEEGDRVLVSLEIPDASKLMPGDSLEGVADEVTWNLIPESDRPLSTTIEVNFDGLDLYNMPNTRKFKARRYTPVIAHLKPGLQAYVPLGVGSLHDTDSMSYGILSSLKQMKFSGDPHFVTIGRMPLSDGPQFYVPNVFSPAARLSENKTFRPFLEGATIEAIQMTIWDGFNKQMYHTQQSNPGLEQVGWDGLLTNGATASEGVYYFSILLETNQGSFQKKGSFILLR